MSCRDYQGLTLDVISKVAFAIDSNSQKDRTDPFYLNVRELFRLTNLRASPWLGLACNLVHFTYFGSPSTFQNQSVTIFYSYVAIVSGVILALC